ncbi:MAG: Maf family protein [Clostridiales bacterium]|nr:Maf family protein [Clostridiales bacterium]
MIILASKSPRRRELLKLITPDFIVKSADVDESLPPGATPAQAVLHLSEIKARELFNGRDCIIGADTVVAFGNRILGKPKNESEAGAMLKMLSAGQHSVYTGVTVLCPAGSKSFFCETKVTFYDISAMIGDYIKTDEPYDKAGAYGIQGRAALFVEKIDGDYNNVVGLPVSRLYKELCSLGVLGV